VEYFAPLGLGDDEEPVEVACPGCGEAVTMLDAADLTCEQLPDGRYLIGEHRVFDAPDAMPADIVSALRRSTECAVVRHVCGS
jgi:hypothetical protein